MKRWLLAALILLLIYGLPFRKYETEKLLPILCLQAQRVNGRVYILSEAGKGSGANWQEAVEDLKRKASGEVFFDTAEQVVFSDASLAVEAAQSGILRPAAEVFLAKGFRDPKSLHGYLSQHGSGLTIADLESKRGRSFASD